MTNLVLAALLSCGALDGCSESQKSFLSGCELRNATQYEYIGKIGNYRLPLIHELVVIQTKDDSRYVIVTPKRDGRRWFVVDRSGKEKNQFTATDTLAEAITLAAKLNAPNEPVPRAPIPAKTPDVIVCENEKEN